MNLIEKWPIGNILIIVDIVITFEYMNNEEDKERYSRKIWEKVQSCEMIPFSKNFTGREKEEFMWEVNQVIRHQIIKGLVCQTKEYEPYSECYREPL